MKIDNFALTMFQTCPAKYDLRIRQRWTTRRKSAPLGFGGATHHGLAAWHDTGSRVKMLEVLTEHWPEGMPVDDYRTKQKCAEVLMAYSKEYPAETFQIVKGPDGNLIEVSFTIPTEMYLPLCYHETIGESGLVEITGCGYDNSLDAEWKPVPDEDGPATSQCKNCGLPLEEIEYGGIFDGLIEFSGAVYVFEHKTTSQLGPTFFDQFRPNNQITGYVWAAGLLSGKRVGGAMVNAIGVYKASPTRFERHITMRSPQEIHEWLNSVSNTCAEIQRATAKQDFRLQTVNCTMYGKCEFHAVHSLSHPNMRQALLEQDYMKSEWNYEARDGD